MGLLMKYRNVSFVNLSLLLVLCGLFAVLPGCQGPMGLQGVPGEDGKDGGNPGLVLQYYTVVYDANGGEGEMENSSFAIGFLGRLRNNNFTNEGFVFNGWSTVVEGPPEYADRDAVEDLSITPNDTVILYAVWGEPNSYTVSYNANGGTGYMPPSVFTRGQVQALPANAYTRTGYNFEGWAETEDGQVKFSNLQSIVSTETNAGETIYLYAVWKPLIYTVVYDAKGGEGLMADSVFTYDEPQALRKNVFIKSGYVFTGWSTAADGPLVFANGGTVQNLSDVHEAVITLYAVWGSPGSYMLVYNANGGSGSMEIDVFTRGQIHSLAAGSFTRSGFVFAGWSIAAKGPLVYADGEQVEDLTEVGETLNLYAVWGTGALYTVNFDPDNGSPIASTIVNGGVPSAKPEDPVKISAILTMPGLYAGTEPDYNLAFAGWYNGNIEWDFDAPVTQDMTLTAKFGPIDLSGISAETGDTVIDKAFAYINANPEEYIFLLDEDIEIAGHSNRTLNQSGTKLSIVGMESEREIKLSSNGNMFTLVGSGINLTLGENITLTGRTANSASLLYVQGGASLIMKGNSSVSGNAVSGSSSQGGGVYVAGSGSSLTIKDNASVSGNEVSGNNSQGGGVYVTGGSFTIQDDAALYENTASSNGGGVYVASGSFTMRDDTSVSENTAGSGGGVHVAGGSFTMQNNAALYENTANNGGGVYVASGNFSMHSDAVLYENTANSGGGVYVAGGSFTMQDNSLVSENTVSSNGGGVYFAGGTNSRLTMQDDAVVSGNKAEYGGGGVYVAAGTFTMQGSAALYENTAGSGGGVHVAGGSFTMGDNTMLYENTSGSGGGVYVAGGSFIMQGNAWMSGNEAISSSSYGGGVHVAGGSFAMRDNAAMSNNKADYGGAVHVAVSGSFTMQDSTSMYANTANLGGGVHVGGGSFNMHGDASVYVNTANSGGGVYVMEGTFRISGGAVYGNDSGYMNNISNWDLGAALSLQVNSTAQYGSFSWAWGTLTDIPVITSGPYIFRNATINVVNGLLQ